MSLRDGTKKMSKSDESDYSRINLNDSPELIEKKIKKATSDSFATIGENLENRPEANNLVTIYASLAGISREAAINECGDMNFGTFKKRLSEAAIAHLTPINKRLNELMDASDYLDGILRDGVDKARGIAVETMSEVKNLVGFLEM